MLSYNDAYYLLVKGLQPMYDAPEASAIVHEVMYTITGLDKVQRLMQKDVVLTQAQWDVYNKISTKLIKGIPMQYAIGHAWFMGRRFTVNEHVLIPRPETEELVQWVINECKGRQGLRILDIGTGSGCIPISLQLAMPAAMVKSCDVSHDALTIAQLNASELKANVQFVQLDFLDAKQVAQLGSFDIIISNPPYIPVADRAEMHANVKDNEPAIALFVPDNDALVFYRAIAEFGKKYLNGGGAIYCELHAPLANETKDLFKDTGYADVLLQKDMYDNMRFIKAK